MLNTEIKISDARPAGAPRGVATAGRLPSIGHIDIEERDLFVKWFLQTYYEICGKLLPPLEEELEELARKSFLKTL